MNPREVAELLAGRRRAELRRELGELGSGLDMSNHACDRAHEMGASAAELDAIGRLGSSWPAGERHGAGRGLLRHHPRDGVGHLALICSPDRPDRVITVIFWSPDRAFER